MSDYNYGHSCINIKCLSCKNIFISNNNQNIEGFRFPGYKKIITILKSLDYFKLPIYFSEKYSSLYIKRLWIYENEIANFIKERTLIIDININDVNKLISSVFKYDDNIYYQKQIVIKSLIYNFSIISGGPGTGKTTLIAKLLLILQVINKNQYKIAILAPTGKAASRITEVLRYNIYNININEYLDISNTINILYKLEGETIHNFLGLKPNSNYIKYNKYLKAPYDLIIIDEASMIDINIFIKLIRCIGNNTKLILIGDVNQLPSIEVGNLLSNLILSNNKSDVSSYTTQLIKNYRSKNYINNLSNDILTGYIDMTKYKNCDNIKFDDLSKLNSYLELWAIKYKELKKISNYKEALRNIIKFRILTVNKNFKISTININQKIEEIIGQDINSNYKGRPIMITKNNYLLNLFNGDIGIIWPNDNGILKAYFYGKEDRSFDLDILPEYESIYAMTIHKTQGSEFDEVAVIFSYEYDDELLSKQLLYTAVTRAKNKITIISNCNLNEILKKSVHRNSNIVNLINN